MTRKQAILEAIKVLSKNNKNNEMIHKLTELSDELPLVHWSDKSIRDTIQQFIVDNNRVPTTTDFKRKGMPSHPVIKQIYKVTLKEFLDLNYSTEIENKFQYAEKIKNEFIKQFKLIKPKSANQYDKMRKTGSPCWYTVATNNEVTRWSDLLTLCNLTLMYKSKNKTTLIKTVSNKIDIVERIKNLE